MKIIEVNYSKKFPYAPYLNEDIGYRASLDEGDDPIECALKLKEIATKAWEQSNPQIQMGTEIRDIPQEPVDKIRGWIQVIELCTNKAALLRFEKQVERENNPELTNAYNNKLKLFE